MLTFQFLLLCILCSFASATTPSYAIHKRAPDRHSGWERGARANSDLVVPVQIDLAEDGIEEVTEELLALSDPSSPSFRKYWSPSQVTSALSLSDEDISSVLEWVGQIEGDPRPEPLVSPCRCRIDFNATIGQLESLLQTKYYTFTHASTGETSIACEDYKVPDSLVDLIDFILPTIFPIRTPHIVHPISSLESTDLKRRNSRVLQPRQRQLDCNDFTTPQCLQEWYNIPSRPANHEIHSNNTFGIFQPAWSSWLPDDLDLFAENFAPELNGSRPKMQKIDGGYYNDEDPNIFFNLEANLDFQYAMALSWPQEVINIQVGDMYLSGNFNHMLAAFDKYYCDSLDPAVDAEYPNTQNPDGYQKLDCGTHEAPKVISISYAWDEGSYPEDYARRQCQEYLKLGLQGITILAASGDEGTAGRETACPDPSNSTENEAGPRPFGVSFPASCPWITAVGGTQKYAPPGEEAKTKETVYTHSFGRPVNSSSTGGFSNVFGVPKYQKEHTKGYLAAEADRLEEHNATSLFNSEGRGVPDISALAADYVVAVHGEFRHVYGTSASTPVVASMITMINGERLLEGKGPVGFLNPVLYSHSDVLEDVIHGENVGCKENHGFRAIEGWDAATGLGSPDYERLRELLLSLP
ncbi:hypothetical protein VUR80DRAFT_9155 [Thermomyces stellatus]